MCVCVCVCVRVHPRVCVMRDTRGMCLLCPGAHGSTAIYFSSFHPSLSRNCRLSHLPPHSFCPGSCSGSERTTHHHCHLYCNWDEPALALALAWLRGPLGNRVGNREGGGGGGWLSLGQEHVIRLCPGVRSASPVELLPSSSPVSAHSDVRGVIASSPRLSPSPRH